MQGKNIVISKWLLIFTFSHVSCFTILQFNDLTKTDVAKLLDTIKDNEVLDENKNNIQETISKHNLRRNLNIQDFKNKKLIKRIVPHGYKVKGLEYDEKFNTLFKPLIRIHQRKTDLDDTKGEKRYDLIYVIDDGSLNESELDKDDSLLQPFNIDNMDIKKLPKQNEIEYLMNRIGLSPEDDYSSDDESGQNRYELIGNKDKMKENDNSNEHWNYYLSENKVKQVLGNQQDHTVQYKIPSKYKIYELINKVTDFKTKIPKIKPVKEYRPTSVGLQSKQFKAKQDRNGREEKGERSYKLKSKKYTNNNDYLKILNQLQQRIQKPIKSKKEDLKDIQGPSAWFGPVGVINSKQFIKSEGKDDTDNSKIYDNNKWPYYQQDMPDTFKETIEQNIETSDEDEYKDFKSVEDDKDETFSPIEYIIQDDWKQETQVEPARYITFKNNKHANNELIETLGQQQAISGNVKKERLIEKLLKNPEMDLLRHVISGEEEKEYEKLVKEFDYADEKITSTTPTNWRPNFPFWNSWTYDKQIVMDDCKGKLIQNGRVCISPWM